MKWGLDRVESRKKIIGSMDSSFLWGPRIAESPNISRSELKTSGTQREGYLRLWRGAFINNDKV